MRIELNGEAMSCEPGATLADLLREWAEEGPGLAAALNGDVVALERWAETPLGEGDRVLLFQAIAGG